MVGAAPDAAKAAYTIYLLRRLSSDGQIQVITFEVRGTLGEATHNATFFLGHWRADAAYVFHAVRPPPTGASLPFWEIMSPLDLVAKIGTGQSMEFAHAMHDRPVDAVLAAFTTNYTRPEK